MYSTLELTLILLAAAVLGVVVFRMLHLPPMLGYLSVGILIGPHAFGLVEDSQATHRLAEFGVVFLMFSIGLEFSLPKLISMRRSVFGLGLAQVVLTIAAAIGIGWLASLILPKYFNIDWRAGFALGGALAMSSTAIVSKLLTERLELESEHGRQMISVLLFQDLALVPLLILIPALAAPANIGSTLLWAAAKATFVLILLLFIGQRLLRGWFKIVVQRRSQELFMLNLLLVTLGAAWITEKAGLSLALGAFVAGMLISETEYRHQVDEDIKPFRDVLLGLFFITVGMLLNVGLVLENWWLVLLLLVIPLLLKFGLIALLARLFGASPGVAIRTGLGLAQAGEFGFLVQLVLASMVLSMLLAPFILNHMDAFALKFSANEWMMQSVALTQIAARSMNTQHHVVIAGFGRSGQSLAKLLEEEGIAYQALDLDPERVQEAQAAGASVSYGDASRRESLVAAGIHRAAALIITYADTASALKLLHHAHELAPTLPVVVRSYDDSDIEKLMASGATEVVPEAIEGSLMLASHALLILGVPLRKVVHRVQAARGERYVSLRGYFHGQSDHPDEGDQLNIRLHSVFLGQHARGIGRALSTLNLQELGAEITAIRRGKVRIAVSVSTVLEAGDIVVLRGGSEGIARAEARLLGA